MLNHISDKTLEMVSTTRNHYPIEPHRRDQQYNCRLRVPSTIPKEQLDDQPSNISEYTTLSRTKRRRSVCRQDNQAATKVRILATRSGETFHRRLHNSVEPVSPTLPEPTMEPHQSLPSENSSRETTSSNNDHSLVAQCSLVPHNPSSQYQFTFTAQPEGSRTTYTNSHLADDKQCLETRRVELIRSKYSHSDLNDNAQEILINTRLEKNSTNSSYKPGQILFLQWCIQHQISQQFFTPADLINFLSDMHTNRSYAISTLQLFRSAVTHLHYHPASLRDDENINTFITTLLRQAPPTRLHRPTINLQPTIDHLSTLSMADISLSKLQSKLAFLLGVTCFLRPSDLQRIPLSSVSVSSDNTLSFEVHCPKEKRGRRRIIKSFMVKAHTNQQVCPVHTFNLFSSRRPLCQATTLFINSTRPERTLSTRTIQRWITRLLDLSTTEKRVSLRSIASSLALQSGIPKEDIVTMGNWASSTTFEHHYRREHLSNFDFTNTLITQDMDNEDNSNVDNDIFFDALETDNLQGS